MWNTGKNKTKQEKCLKRKLYLIKEIMWSGNFMMAEIKNLVPVTSIYETKTTSTNIEQSASYL